jgi:hypothetical protein
MSSLPPNHLQCNSFLHHPLRRVIPVLHNTQTNIIVYLRIPCSSDGEIPTTRMQKRWWLMKTIKQNKTLKTCCVHTSVVTCCLVTVGLHADVGSRSKEETRELTCEQSARMPRENTKEVHLLQTTCNLKKLSIGKRANTLSIVPLTSHTIASHPYCHWPPPSPSHDHFS